MAVPIMNNSIEKNKSASIVYPCVFIRCIVIQRDDNKRLRWAKYRYTNVNKKINNGGRFSHCSRTEQRRNPFIITIIIIIYKRARTSEYFSFLYTYIRCRAGPVMYISI